MFGSSGSLRDWKPSPPLTMYQSLVRTPSRLELSYLQTASELSLMIAGGHFPFVGQRSDHADTPRVGDGFIRVDEDGRVVYASPNALSVYRKLGLSGDLSGQSLAEVTRALVPSAMRPDEETLSAVLGGRRPRDRGAGGEVRADRRRFRHLRRDGEAPLGHGLSDEGTGRERSLCGLAGS